MDPVIKRRWVKALRSGEFKQEREQLVSTSGKRHCCLGVLCVIQAKPGYEMWWPSAGTPPHEFRAGLTDDDMEILIDANDEARWTFDDIATYVEVML